MKSDVKAKTCKHCSKPAMHHRALCITHYREYQREYMRKKYKEEKEIYLRLEGRTFALDPFIYQDGYELQVRRISKTAGIKIELIKNNESHAIILPSVESRSLMSYMRQVFNGEA